MVAEKSRKAERSMSRRFGTRLRTWRQRRISYTYDAAGNRLTHVVQSGVAPDRVAPVIPATPPINSYIDTTAPAAGASIG
jgi:hypothetical protein